MALPVRVAVAEAVQLQEQERAQAPGRRAAAQPKPVEVVGVVVVAAVMVGPRPGVLVALLWRLPPAESLALFKAGEFLEISARRRSATNRGYLL